MRLRGYHQRGPDPISRGVMAAPPRTRIPRLPRLRWHPLCILGRHNLDFDRLRAYGEDWSTFVFFCVRCRHFVGESHAARSDWPVDRTPL